MPHTLPQRMYLLSYTVEKEKFETNNLQFRGQKLRAAALVELILAGLISIAPAKREKVVRSASPSPSDSFLAEVWHETTPEKPTSWLDLVHLRAHTAESAVREQLVTLGDITLDEKSRKKLSLLSQHQVTVMHPEHVLALREKSRETVTLGLDPATIPFEDVAMTVLATESDVGHHIFSRSEARTHKKTIKAYGEHFDAIVPGLRKAVQTSMAALRPTGGGWGS
ncbi:hypothetical protein QR77_04545 [Streptomyces sp. 150FB]|uniref:GOLPH3/VPS74 family protein n=1 Tax=Streptomyces sp. 150FB TaxID=1576605 RepID=UPI0005891CC3|nr:GPP34 family phosphoprotein [Streptomyces sp. 150FB]KIF73424.1 hypothetical protein QR77_04545 [Streptomyces sp. 150FB]